MWSKIQQRRTREIIIIFSEQTAFLPKPKAKQPRGFQTFSFPSFSTTSWNVIACKGTQTAELHYWHWHLGTWSRNPPRAKG